MGQPLRILLIEDNDDDATLVLRILRNGGYDPQAERIQTRGELETALQRGGWDLVLSDYSLPRLDALDALEIIRSHSLQLPCIVVSGNIGEETAVRTMRAGANDYLMKSNLTRLLPAVERELRQTTDHQERVQTKKALLDLREQFAVVFQEFADAMVIARADDGEGEILHANPALERALGLPERAVLGRTLACLWPERRRHHAAELLERLRKETQVLLSAESLRRPDGTTRPMDVLASIVPWGRGQAVVLTLRDVTERRRAERRLAAEKEQLAVTLRSIGEGVITTDAFGRVMLLNRVAEELTGWAQSDAVGQALEEVFPVFHPNTGDSLGPDLEHVQSVGAHPNLPRAVRLHARDGRDLIISLTASSIRAERGDSRQLLLPDDTRGSSSGDAAGAVLVFRDITHERKLEEEMAKASKLESLGILAGGIAHDFNNLLMAILGNLSLAKFNARTLSTGVDGDPAGAEVIGILEKAEQACHYATDLTRQLLTFAKGGAPIKRIASLDELVRETVEFALHGTRLTCAFDLPADLLPVEVDGNQFRQVLDNIVINAVQATPDGGQLGVQGRNIVVTPEEPVADLPPGDYVCIAIRDRGVGIAPESLSKIFDPFFTTKESGSGLGLATSYSILKKHDGTILVDSAPGAGATFSIYLPAARHLPPPAIPGGKGPAASGENGAVLPPSALPEPAAGSLDGRASLPTAGAAGSTARLGRVLFMDDEETLRELVADMLRLLGYNVVCASSGEEAVQHYTDARRDGKPFDAVIVDLTVPGGMGGMEAVQFLRELEPGVRAIVSSGYSNDPIMANHRAHGFRGVIAKPYQMAELARVLGEVLKT